MKLHKRHFKVAEAKAEFNKAFLDIDIEKKYELTYGEMFEMLAERTRRLADCLVSDERDTK